MSELKKCPFCGGETKIKSRYIGYGSIGLGAHDWFTVSCQECHAKSDECADAEQAITAWNRRAQESEPPANEPLTLSELYDTDNEPLYFHCTVGAWRVNGWHIVKPINYDGAHFKDVRLDNNDERVESLYNYGITWTAYRAKPERSET